MGEQQGLRVLEKMRLALLDLASGCRHKDAGVESIHHTLGRTMT
jgi:hypothetical protein